MRLASAGLAFVLLAGCSSGDDEGAIETAPSSSAVAAVDEAGDSTVAVTTGTSAPEPVATSTISPSTTSPPATSTTVVATLPATTAPAVDYGQQYLDLIAPVNCALARGNEVAASVGGADGVDSEEWQTGRSALIESHRSEAAGYVAGIESFATSDWPDEVQDDIDQLISELSQLASYMDQLARAESHDQWVNVIESTSIQNSAAAIIRAKLGLETNVGGEASCE